MVEARLDADNGVFSVCDGDLAHHIKELIGVTATVRTKPGTVERSLGNAKRDRSAGERLTISAAARSTRAEIPKVSCGCVP